jgi:tRNA 2-thiouridine synthesizing protein A
VRRKTEDEGELKCLPSNVYRLTTMDPDLEVDARGLLCPLPILRLARAFRGAQPGTVARLLATDPAAVEDVNVFCREKGHELLSTDRKGKELRFRIRKADS